MDPKLESSAVPNEKVPYERWTLLDESSVHYGYLSKTGGRGIETVPEPPPHTTEGETTQSSSAPVAAIAEISSPVPPSSSSFYITTAINYTNGPGHMGHAYEAATSDVIARHQRLLFGPTSLSSTVASNPDDDPNPHTPHHAVYFVTGADEHGQKIAEAAAAQGVAPIALCDQYCTGFRVLNQRLQITNDDYIRTTSVRHKRTAQQLWRLCAKADDIYLDTYTGWYNVREETFVTETDAALADFCDAVSGVPLKRVEEESYFFRMSKYKDRLIQYIEVDNADFIQPVSHKNLILQRLKSDDLRDLSISRTTFDWGIPVPQGFNDNHVMYVWMDALSNYLTGVNALGVNDGEGDISVVIDEKDDGNISSNTKSNAHLARFWPANVHIIGKDILWFHTVIWPCLLMSAGLALPKTVFAHGFVNDKEGKKMSKSLGNVVDPHDMLDKFDVDTFRWYMCKEAPYGGELSFSEDSMRDMHNSDLCGTLGNLVHRATSLCVKYCGGVVPDVPAPATILPIANLGELLDLYNVKMNHFELQGGANVAMQCFRDVNGYLQDQAPWHIKDNLEAQQIVVRATLEAVYALTHLLLPFLPNGGSKIFCKLGTDPVALSELNRDCRNLKVGTTIYVGDILYNPILSEDNNNDASAAVAGGKKSETHAEAQKRKKEAKAAQIAASKAKQADAAEEDSDQPNFTKMDIRVGKIVKVWNHECADKLFCEQIDVGDAEGPREIASGLREHYSLDEMQDRMVLVVCNLKAAKIVGFSSNGMVLAAKATDGSKVELIDAPVNALVGERVFVDGLTGEALSSTQIKKKKTWETVAVDLKTGEDGVATWKGQEIKTSAGVCKAASLVGAPIA